MNKNAWNRTWKASLCLQILLHRGRQGPAGDVAGSLPAAVGPHFQSTWALRRLQGVEVQGASQARQEAQGGFDHLQRAKKSIHKACGESSVNSSSARTLFLPAHGL